MGALKSLTALTILTTTPLSTKGPRKELEFFLGYAF